MSCNVRLIKKADIMSAKPGVIACTSFILHDMSVYKTS